MYFGRRCNQDWQNRINRPSVCRNEEVISDPEIPVVFKTACAGGITFFGSAGTEKEYDLIFLRLACSLQGSVPVAVHFSCNLTLVHSKADVRIQLVKLGGNIPVPIGSPAVYRRVSEFTGADTIFFTIHDPDPAQNELYGYLIKLYITGSVSENGMVIVTNPVLTAMLL